MAVGRNSKLKSNLINTFERNTPIRYVIIYSVGIRRKKYKWWNQRKTQAKFVQTIRCPLIKTQSS